MRRWQNSKYKVQNHKRKASSKWLKYCCPAFSKTSYQQSDSLIENLNICSRPTLFLYLFWVGHYSFKSRSQLAFQKCCCSHCHRLNFYLKQQQKPSRDILLLKIIYIFSYLKQFMIILENFRNVGKHKRIITKLSINAPLGDKHESSYFSLFYAFLSLKQYFPWLLLYIFSLSRVAFSIIKYCTTFKVCNILLYS